ncbi:unnamed protein product (macronuclear) [Paramecium tetraurelia]|uniref:RING-type domain-containing protein n=1 Tax=Paramecium tetraurelia TaxID=5888 RepID=A0C4H9_PARTE|nr:uncharacterized protein GSPATT00035176001 [Paramecium tetraurelia]CAK65696.1 unnamed protein product [Paramecium tetraurelia]|eukprot:XP_001433093.1 hypothetical protein (macronuclear) [Paramecium tetraurelia strain d4-2]
MNLSFLSSSKLREIIVNPNNLNKNLICVICEQLVWDPNECSQCQNNFCSICINEWLKKKKNCPFECTKRMQLNAPHRILRNQISELQVKCVNKGCPKEMQLQNLESHLKQCEYIETKCPYPDCLFKDSLIKIEPHKTSCEHRTRVCQKCLETYKVKDNHDCLDIVIKKVKKQEDQINKLLRRLDCLEENQVLLESKILLQQRNSKK